MQPIILAISGKKNSGKNTIAQFVANYFSLRFRLGQSLSHATFLSHVSSVRGQESVRFFSFADTLKSFCIETLGLRAEQCYGSDAQKNEPTPFLWENVEPTIRSKCEKTLGRQTGFISGRHVMQILGTELVRDTFGNVWADATIRRIRKEQSPLSIITDNRFPNEVQTILTAGGFVLRLLRDPFGKKDGHPSEVALDSFNFDRENCFVLDNRELTEEEQNIAVMPILESIIIRKELKAL